MTIDPKRKELRAKYAKTFAPGYIPLKKEEEIINYWLSVLDSELENKIKEVRDAIGNLRYLNKEAKAEDYIEEVDERAYDGACLDVLSLPSLSDKTKEE